MSRSLLSGALLVAVGAAVGGAVGALVVAARPEVPGTAPSSSAAATPARVDDLEGRMVALERKAAGRVRARVDGEPGGPGGLRSTSANGAATAAPGAATSFWSADGGDGEAAVTTEFVRAVREAIGSIQRENKAASAAQGRENQRKRAMDEVDKRLRDYVEQLDLSDAEVQAFRSAAATAWDTRKDAEAAGATNEELAALDRDKERAYRDVLGSATHRAFRKLEIDRVARPVIVDVANRAGVDQDQRNRIERLLADHIDRYVGPETRLRTEELDADTRASIVRDLTEANRSAWDRLRNQILTPEQRDRVPVRLR